MACLDVSTCNKTVNNNVENNDLELYYFNDLFVENYKDILFNLNLRVYKDVPFSYIKKYKLSNIYYGDFGYFYIKNVYGFRNVIPLWRAFSKTYKL